MRNKILACRCKNGYLYNNPKNKWNKYIFNKLLESRRKIRSRPYLQTYICLLSQKHPKTHIGYLVT